MANLPVSRKEFQHAGGRRLEVAGALVYSPSSPSGRPLKNSKHLPQTGNAGTHPQLAAYLVQVGLECWLKARILFQAGVDTSDQYERKVPDSLIFKTSRGHNLEFLSLKAELGRLLCAEGKQPTLLEDQCWKRMSKDPRPYSLRYGTDKITLSCAREELERARLLADVLQRNIWPFKNK